MEQRARSILYDGSDFSLHITLEYNPVRQSLGRLHFSVDHVVQMKVKDDLLEAPSCMDEQIPHSFISHSTGGHLLRTFLRLTLSRHHVAETGAHRTVALPLRCG
jgi:hypothetical protein